jgi:ABC-2 type transport system permease protein/sodium transport system permease protein
VQLFFLLVLFAAFFSAVLLALTSFARSFKEAQAYLIPLMLVSLAPGVVGMMPGLRLRGVLAVTPLVNIVLLARDLSEHTATFAGACAVVASTLVYALAAITIAARIFGAEAVLFSEQSAWSDMFRRPAKPAATATVAGALLCLALLLPCCFVVDSALPRVALEARQALQVSATIMLFLGLPLLTCWLARIHVASAFQLRLPRWQAWPAALLLAVATVPVMFYVLALLQARGLTLFNAQMEQQVRALVRLSSAGSSGPIALASTVALVGIAEEAFFRGFLFSALRASTGQWLTILASAVLFGLFHFVSILDRLIPSTLMGILLGWVCWQTRSVLPSMLLHATYNAMLVLVKYYNAEQTGEDAMQEVLAWWQIAAIPCVAIGFGLLLDRGFAPWKNRGESAHALAKLGRQPGESP